MCGFLGLYSFSKRAHFNLNQEWIFARRGSRPPEVFRENRIFFAHTLLPIRYPETRQPYITKCNRYIFIYNGEDYSTNSSDCNDTLTISKLLSQYGPISTLSKLEGEFSIAIYDRLGDELFLGRDHFGVKPMFLGRGTKKFAFGSCSSDVAKLVGATIDPQRIAEYISLLTTPGGTFWREVTQVSPGSVIKIAEDTLEVIRSPSKTPSSPILDWSLAEEIKSTAYNDKAAILLSGGLDSSIIAYEMSQLGLSKNITAITYHGAADIDDDDPSQDELKKAQTLARKLGVHHTTVGPLTPHRFIEALVESTPVMGSPMGNCWLPHFMCYQRVGYEGINVAFTGDGADDIFGGYIWRYYQKGTNQMYCGNAGYSHVEIAKILHPTYARHCENVDQAIWNATLEVSPTPETALIRFARKRILPNLLHQTDALAGFFSIEVRVPFLRTRLTHAADILNHRVLINRSHGKLPLRVYYIKHLGTNIAYGRKNGFLAHETSLYRGGLSRLITYILESSPLWEYGIVSQDFLSEAWISHRTGVKDFRKTLWSLLAVDAFLNLNCFSKTVADLKQEYLKYVASTEIE